MKTVAQVIAEFALQTSSPRTFVESVTTLFTGKGIRLDEDGSPYETAIRETFECEQKIRLASEEARRGLTNLADRLTKLGESWERQLAEIERLRRTMADASRGLESHAAMVRARRHGVVPGPPGLQ